MKCTALAERIERLQPKASARDVARLCLLLANGVDDLDRLEDTEALKAAWRAMNLKLQAATDEHAAMTEELDAITRSNPQSFSAEQVWALIRAIKVQSQILQLYVGETPVDV
ncbi:MAG TPA: hypothetical protein ENJ50_10810 [Planctomycetaceae bacterium]|nr:hypothetical protein [Planctomycetaceae bacterium]